MPAISDELAVAYWAAVADELVRRSGESPEVVAGWIATYRRALAEAGVRDEVYHAAVADTADGIITGGYTGDRR